MKEIWSLYALSYPMTLVYMLQSTEYRAGPYIKWFWRTNDFRQVIKRRALERTKAARLLLLIIWLGIFLQIALGLLFIWVDSVHNVKGIWQLGVAIIIAYPVVWAHMIVLPIIIGRWLVIAPKEKRLIRESRGIFAGHPGVKIAVAGSYGKTTMKELLGTILSESKNVAITPANKNVASSHAVFASKLTGKEDVLVIEYGEGRSGDVSQFAETTQPNIGVITGVAPAHLDQYPTLEAAAKDIFSLADYLHDEQVYVNAESEAAQSFINKSHLAYTSDGVADWKVRDVSVSFDGVSFSIVRGKKKLNLKSRLLGRHQIGPLTVAAAIAHKLGLSAHEIEVGVSKTQPFEHRMQPRYIHGAWIIDDTYNGNVDGIKAGLALLKELPAIRKVYVTPGLVDQGVETERVHVEMGRLIADANPDQLVLMHNSATPYIKEGLQRNGYKGAVKIEDNPLEFYSNIEYFIAAGDVILMQNDWTDNYR